MAPSTTLKTTPGLLATGDVPPAAPHACCVAAAVDCYEPTTLVTTLGPHATGDVPPTAAYATPVAGAVDCVVHGATVSSTDVVGTSDVSTRASTDCSGNPMPHIVSATAPPPPEAAAPDGFSRLMASARIVWGRRPVDALATTVAPVIAPPPPRDAFAALMQAAAAHPTCLMQASDGNGGRGVGANVRAGQGKGGRGNGGKGSRGNGGVGGGQGRRLAPFKRIEGTPFIVDGFTCGANQADQYFLSHFHADHYQGSLSRQLNTSSC